MSQFPSDWVELSDCDESESYEVDQVIAFKTPEGYALATASGCSCWDGEYDVEQHKTLELLALALFREERQYTPSLKGALSILRDIFKAGY